MLFSRTEKEKPKKKHGGTLLVCTLATVGAYAIVSTVKNKMCKMIHGMHKFFQGKKCECEPSCDCGDVTDEYGMK